MSDRSPQNGQESARRTLRASLRPSDRASLELNWRVTIAELETRIVSGPRRLAGDGDRSIDKVFEPAERRLPQNVDIDESDHARLVIGAGESGWPAH